MITEEEPNARSLDLNVNTFEKARGENLVLCVRKVEMAMNLAML